MLYINYFFPRVMFQSVGSVVHLSARKRSFVSVVGPEKGRSFCADLVFFVELVTGYVSQKHPYNTLMTVLSL